MNKYEGDKVNGSVNLPTPWQEFYLRLSGNLQRDFNSLPKDAQQVVIDWHGMRLLLRNGDLDERRHSDYIEMLDQNNDLFDIAGFSDLMRYVTNAISSK